MRLAETVTFGGSGLDRAAHLRGDPDRIASLRADPTAKVIAIWRDKPMFLSEGLAWLPEGHPVLADAGDARIFLGLDESGPRFAADISAWEPPPGAAQPEGGFLDPTEQRHPEAPEAAVFAELRSRMTMLGPRDAELVATAKALFGWHRSHGFCAVCGQPSYVAHAGWQRQCKACGAQHFPRTDPVVIMLVTQGNAVLLGRSAPWPPRMFSLLAGFMEPGEAMEAAVRREVFEETGVRVGPVSYLSSQPWPYPSSLMLGCRAEALSTDITIDPTEIEAARWVTREELADVFAGTHPEIAAPRRGAIAGFLLWHWLADRLD